MSLTLHPVGAPELDDVVATVASWQDDGIPVQVHPGDLGWQWRLGDDVLARSLRVWRRGTEVVALAYVDPGDGGALARLAVSPDVDSDEEVAAAMLADLTDPAAGLLTAQEASVEARYGSALRAALAAHGWQPDEAWTPLVRDLADPVEAPGMEVRVIEPEDLRGAQDVVTVLHAAFARSTYGVDRWRTMTATSAFRHARGLVGYDPDGSPAATVVVWSAGEGRPGLVEPMGVHGDHRGEGYGRAISLAGAATLRELGASSVLVATPSQNVAAVRTYESAGFTALPVSADFRRPG